MMMMMMMITCHFPVAAIDHHFHFSFARKMTNLKTAVAIIPRDFKGNYHKVGCCVILELTGAV